MKVLAWYIELDGNKNDYTINCTFPYDVKKCGNLIIDTQMVVKKTLLDTLVCKERGSYCNRACFSFIQHKGLTPCRCVVGSSQMISSRFILV